MNSKEKTLRNYEYIRQKGIEPTARIFPISYPAARIVVKKAGEIVGIRLRPHDLRRHAATYASQPELSTASVAINTPPLK